MDLSEIGTLCADTPHMVVFDPRGLTLREVDFNREKADEVLEALVTRYQYGERGEMQTCCDPRFSQQSADDETQHINLSIDSDLLQQPLYQKSVDSGESLCLWHADGQRQWLKNSDNESPIIQHFNYDKSGRPLSLIVNHYDKEQLVQTWRYGEQKDKADVNNCCGQCIAIQDGAGTQEFSAFDIQGRNRESKRRFLLQRDQRVDWNNPPTLESQIWINRVHLSAQGSADQTSLFCKQDNKERQIYLRKNRYNRRQQLVYSEFIDEDGKQNIVLKEANYHANGQCQQEILGNNISRYYAQEQLTKRLLRISTWRKNSEDQTQAIQDLSYQYDPVGNLVASYNLGQVDHFFDNLRVTAQNLYRYDSCYQLRYASGRETLTGGKATITPLVSGTSQLINYQRWYGYDSAGNMTNLRHLAGQNSWQQQFSISTQSNRRLAQPISVDEVENNFNAQGNLLNMDGKRLFWSPLQQLVRVDGLRRANGASDYEYYQYDANGQRCSKLSSKIANGITQSRRNEKVTYLSDMCLCEYDYEGKPQTSHYMLSFSLAGLSSVTFIYHKKEKEQSVQEPILRFSCQDRQGSVALELTESGDIISQEEYYPFGGTSLFSSRSEGEAEYKYYRYSGKERDNLSGLYNYGFRYYAPWLCCWISPDPLGMVDGPNLYCMVNNNPVTHSDFAGLSRYQKLSPEEDVIELNDMSKTATAGRTCITNNAYNSTTSPIFTPSRSIAQRMQSIASSIRQTMGRLFQGVMKRFSSRGYSRLDEDLNSMEMDNLIPSSEPAFADETRETELNSEPNAFEYNDNYDDDEFYDDNHSVALSFSSSTRSGSYQGSINGSDQYFDDQLVDFIDSPHFNQFDSDDLISLGSQGSQGSLGSFDSIFAINNNISTDSLSISSSGSLEIERFGMAEPDGTVFMGDNVNELTSLLSSGRVAASQSQLVFSTLVIYSMMLYILLQNDSSTRKIR